MLEYEINGEKNERAILLIHGALLSKSMWNEQIDFLEPGYKVISINLPGHGNSPMIESEYTIENITEEVHRLIEMLKIKKMILCGHSLGGMVAQQLAFKYPDLVQKLILAETAFGTRNNLWEKILSLATILTLKLTSRNQLISLSAHSYGANNPKVKEYISKEMENYTKETMLKVISSALNFKGKYNLKGIKVPTLILIGENNKRTHRQGEVMNELLFDSYLIIIQKANHLLNIDNPKAFNEGLINFMENRQNSANW